MLNFFFTLLLIFSLSRAELLIPENGAVLNFIHILFQWEQEPDAIGYNLQALDQYPEVVLDIENSTTTYIDDSTFIWNKSYIWRVRPLYLNGSKGEWSAISSFATGEPLPYSSLNVHLYNDDLIQEGLMMFTQFAPDFGVRVIDKFGSQIWNSQYSYINHWNNFGQLYGMMGGGQGGKITFYNQILWISPEGTEVDGHEIKQIPNGNYMGLVPAYQLGPIPLGDWTQNYQNLGYAADGVTNEFQWRGCKIIEWDEETGEEVWSWDPFEHFTMDDYDTLEGQWWNPLSGGGYGLVYDWMHSNAFHFDEADSVIYVSHRNLSRISIIAYPSGEVIWNMGMPAEYGSGDDNFCTDLLFSCQHHIQHLDNGDLLFFDNGNLSEMLLGDPYPTTRIRRISVIDDSYCETIWQYDLPPELFSSGMGSVQLLENGNYFVYTHGSGHEQGAVCTILEVTPEGDVVWEGSHLNINAAWYRAYKIPSIHPAATSVLLNQYQTIEIDGNFLKGIVLDDGHSDLSFTIYNQSGYSQPYAYTLSDDSGWFTALSDTAFIEAGNQSSFSFYPEVQGDSVTSLQLVVTPVYHDWFSIDLNYDIYRITGGLEIINKTTIPQAFSIYQNHPNPFNHVTTLRYDLPESALVNITIYDMMGRIVNNLVSSKQSAGYKSVQWNGINNSGQSVSAGLYFYTIQAGDPSARSGYSFREGRKMVFLK